MSQLSTASQAVGARYGADFPRKVDVVCAGAGAARALRPRLALRAPPALLCLSRAVSVPPYAPDRVPSRVSP
eukprot:766626-Rhodomonas_salina.2